MCTALDKLDDFRKYDSNVRPMLRKAVDEGWSSRRIRKELATFSQALVIQQALGGNVSRASQIAAIQDVLDRYDGPARRQGKVSEKTPARKELVTLLRQKLSKADSAKDT